jgi:hypothetical protein
MAQKWFLVVPGPVKGGPVDSLVILPAENARAAVIAAGHYGFGFAIEGQAIGGRWSSSREGG